MPITTKNVIIDDAEEPNALTAPRRPDHNAPYYQPPRRARRIELNPYALLAVVLVALAVAGVLIFFAVRVGNYIADVNAGYAGGWFDLTLLAITKIAITLGVALVLVAPGIYLFGRALGGAIIRLQNGMPVSTFNILAGWRDSNNAAAIFATLDRYYAEREQWANNSGFWSLQTLDASRSATDRREFNSGGADVLIGDGSNQPPSHIVPRQGEELTIETLLRHGLIDRSGNSFLIGMNRQKPFYIELDDSGFIGVAGSAGSGKSGTAKSIVAQTLLLENSIVIVCDKHGKKPESLIATLRPVHNYLARVAIDIDDIIAAIDHWYEIGSNRLLEETDRRYPEALLVIDEFTAMVSLELLPNTSLLKLLGGAVEFRKVQAHGVIAGHSWTGRLMGAAIGAPLRRAMTDRIVHRIDPQDAGFLLPTSHKNAVTALHNGHAIYIGANQLTPLEIAVPEFTARDFEYLARVLAHRTGKPATPYTPPSADPLGNVAAVAAVAAASDSPATQPHTDRTNGGRPATNGNRPIGNPRVNDLTDDGRARLARILLVKKLTNGEWLYSIDDVQSLTNLRTSTIIDISRSVGRSQPRS